MVSRIKFLYFICLFSVIYFAECNVIYAQVTITENSYQSWSVKFHIDSKNIDFDKIETPYGDFLTIRMKDFYLNSGRIGYPKLPIYRKLIEIPWDADIKLIVKNQKEKILALEQKGFKEKFIPIQASISKNDTLINVFYLDSNIYNKNEFLGGPVVWIEKQGFMRGKNIVLLTISPLQYNPVSNELKVFENIEVDIQFENANIQKTNYEKAKTDYFNYIPLDNQKRTFIHVAKPIKYVIVSNPMFRKTLKSFIQWKIRQGFEIIEAYTDNPEVGSSPQAIRKYLKNLYDQSTPENPAPFYLLLVGDVEQLPAFEGKANVTGSLGHITDLYYAEFTGDYLPEMIYGRFPANNTQQLENMISKTILYEQYQFPDPSFLDKTMLIAGFDNVINATYSNGQMNYLNSEYFSADKGFITKKYASFESVNKAAEIKQHLDSGMALVNFSAHCLADGWKNPHLSPATVSQIANDKKYPIVISNCCLSGNFSVSECLGEAFLRTPNGAIGYIGASDNTFWDEDYYWSVGIGEIMMNPTYDSKTQAVFDYWLHQREEGPDNWALTQGQLLQSGNLSVAIGSTSKSLYYAEIYNLFGDPSLKPFLKQPQPLQVKRQDSLFINQTQLQVETEPYTYVALSSDTIVLAASMSNSQGFATLNFKPLQSANNLYLFADKQFRIHSLDTLPVSSHSNSTNVLIQNEIEFNINPNPTVGFVNIEFELPYSMNFSLQIYDMQGILQETLFSGFKEQGACNFCYHTKLLKGTYLCVFRSNSNVLTKKLIISD